MKNLVKILTLVFLPLSTGGFIYIISRSRNLKLFDWFESIRLSNQIEFLRLEFQNVKFQDWIIYNLPDFLWVFSFTSLIIIIWNRQIRKENIIYLILPTLLGIISELGQQIRIINGTYDIIDIIFYVAGGILSYYVTLRLKF